MVLIMAVLIMEYLTATELSKLWNISTRRIGVLCTEGRVEGAVKKGKTTNYYLTATGAKNLE